MEHSTSFLESRIKNKLDTLVREAEMTCRYWKKTSSSKVVDFEKDKTRDIMWEVMKRLEIIVNQIINETDFMPDSYHEHLKRIKEMEKARDERIQTRN